MKIQVPKEVDVKGLVAALKLSKTQTINLKNKTYYFLSCIVSDNDNLNTDNYGYRNICSVLMKKLIGDKEYYKILKLLTSVKDPIIESDNSYHNPKIKGKGKGYCKGYRLTEKYNSGELAYKTLPVKFDKKIKRYGTDNNEGVTINEKYQFLFNQFENNQIGLDPLVYDYINSFVAALILRVKDKNIYQIKLVYNYIGRCLYYLSKFENSELWKNVSANNHRFNSSITSLPKILRPFINCNNKEMVMLDISSSQPYLLSSIINNNFFKDTNDGYNLKTIYNELYLELIVKGYININNSSNNININYSSNSSNNNTISYNSNNTSNTNNTFINNTGTPSFMWSEKFSQEDLNSMVSYQQSPFHLDYYAKVVEMNFKKSINPLNVDAAAARQQFKKSNMFVLFDSNYNHRNHNPNIKMFNFVYPGMNRWIESAHKVIGQSRFAYLLQRAESYLILNVICREFNIQFPDAPLFTIHDGIYTYEEHIPELTSLIIRRCKEVTGVEVGVKIKKELRYTIPLIEDIDNVWDNIKDIVNEKKYEKIRNCVFTGNIDRCNVFLENIKPFLQIFH